MKSGIITKVFQYVQRGKNPLCEEQIMKKIFYRHRATLIGISLILTVSCATGIYLRTERAQVTEISGTYTIILYGGRYSADMETIAILDKEGDKYTFEVYAPEFDYKIKHGVPAEEALEEAEKFVRFHHSFWQARLSKIIDPAGKTIGYEIRPLYHPIDFGYSDVLDVYYVIKDSKVIVTISLIPEVQRILFDDDRPFLFKGIKRRR